MENISKEPEVAVKGTTLRSDESTKGRVRILNDQVVNQIAAGEVVERPASVVKELVENSLDAGATEITVNIANGGKSLIEISDNGYGMSKHDALLAIERFGTSKISTAQDLVEIATLGFRGEALPSIASVSEFSLESRAQESKGVQIEISGGTVRSVSEIDRPVGTRIRVKRLFFNTPARRKFLRTDRTEEGQIKATVNDFALAYPKTRFRLVVDGKETISVVPAKDLFERSVDFKLAGKKPITINESHDTKIGRVSIQAVLSQPLECVAGSNRLRLMVNGRVVRDKLLIRAIREGYGNFLHGSSYPAGVLSLTIPPTEVDVNVHPQKAEVRFRATDVIFSSITLAIKRSFDTFSILPAVQEVGHNRWEDPVPLENRSFDSNKIYPVGASVSNFEQRSLFVAPSQQDALTSKPQRTLTQARYLGQILKLYLLFEEDSSLFIVDMHAAHERIRFFQIKQKLLGGDIATQLLAVPETIDLPPESVAEVVRLKPMLAKLGIDCDVIDSECLLVRGVPAVLAASAEGRTDAQAIIADLISLAPGKNWQQFLEDRIDEVVARMACHSSIRSGRVLKAEEAYALVESLETAERSGLCPHGRPVVVELSEKELEQLFGRVQ